jgi:hypothetical protein
VNVVFRKSPVASVDVEVAVVDETVLTELVLVEVDPRGSMTPLIISWKY